VFGGLPEYSHAVTQCSVSLIFQRGDLSITGRDVTVRVGAEVNTAIEKTAKLPGGPQHGANWRATCMCNFVKSRQGFSGPRTALQSPVMPMARMFWAFNFWRTLNADRLYLYRHLAGALFERFKSGLSDLVVMAFKFSVLNHKHWPYVQVDVTQEKLDYIALGVYGANDS
jgi:hypothetical protein